VVADNLLREVTREHLALLLALTSRPIASSSSSAGAKAGAGADGGSVTASLAAAAQQLGGEGEGGLPVFELMLGGQPAAAQVLVATLVAGMCWPDAEGISKAVQACRYLVGLGLRLPPLEEYVARDLLRAAITSLVQGASALVQPELLALLRQLLTSYLPRPLGGPVVRQTLLQLLQLQPQVLADFECKLGATGVEKDQRMLIKQLVAQAGGEEVRKLLAAPATLLKHATSVPNLGKARDPAARAAADADTTQAVIFNAIFTS
ncbi:hypothetical protein QJQ45_015371, partial [Haematococcus lacustris]